MKVFILAVTILALTAAFIWWCGWYVNHVFDIMLKDIGKLPVECGNVPVFGETYLGMERKWFDSKSVVGMILGKDETEKVTELLVEMGIRYIGGDDCGYQTTKEKLHLYISKLQEGEQIGVDMLL